MAYNLNIWEMEGKTYTIQYRCLTCGSTDYFESNEDKSYIKCTMCNREYFGGLQELRDLNAETINEAKEYVKQDARKLIEKELKKVFKGSKYIKFK